MTKHIRAARFAFCLLFLSLAAAQNSGETVMGITQSTPEFSTAARALEAAGLSETLGGAGPYTLFAPTNEAFKKLSQSELEALFANREGLKRVLSYHIVKGSFTTADISKDMKAFATLEGEPLKITARGVANATVTMVNIPAANGVVFAVDTLLQPPAEAQAAAAPAQTTQSAQPTEGAASDTAAEAPASKQASNDDRLALSAANGSDISGTVLLKPYGDSGTIVSISASGMAEDLEASLQAGSCEQPGNALEELGPVSVATGLSTTLLDTPYADLRNQGGSLALSQNGTVVACATLP